MDKTKSKKIIIKNKPLYLKKPYCKAFYGLSINGFHDTFTIIKKKYPELIQCLLYDLLRVEGYSETEIAFGLNIPLYVIREIVDGNFTNTSREIFLAIVHLYARVFCGRCRFSET